MIPALYNLRAYRGDTLEVEMRIRQRALDGTFGDPLDLTDAVISAQIRSDFDALDSYDFDVELVDAENGEVKLTIPAIETPDLPIKGVWDMQIELDGKVSTYVRGKVEVIKDVTQ